MTRKILAGAGVFLGIVVLISALMWLIDPGTIAIRPIPWYPGPLISAAIIGLLAGFAGATIASLFRVGSRRWSRRLSARIDELENWRAVERKARETAASASAPPPPPPSSRRQEVPASAYGMTGPEWETQGAGQPAQAPPAVPSRPIIPLNDIVMRYGKVAAGHISRSNFAEFFESVGQFGPVEIAEGGQSITVTSNEESFLTAVNAGSAILVFPSYDFVANQETQFNTIASVPDDVAVLFELARGDGEIVLDRPAVFEETEAGPNLRSKGELRGFGG